MDRKRHSPAHNTFSGKEATTFCPFGRLSVRYLMLCLLFISLNQSAVVALAAEDGVNRMSVRELKAKMDKEEDIVVVDVRSGNDYERSKIRIKGAVRISIVQLRDRAQELPKEKEIITYCT